MSWPDVKLIPQTNRTVGTMLVTLLRGLSLFFHLLLVQSLSCAFKIMPELHYQSLFLDIAELEDKIKGLLKDGDNAMRKITRFVNNLCLYNT